MAEHGQNTIGVLKIDHKDHPTIWTCEDLWRDNEKNVSSIPAGTYRCDPHGWEDHNKYTFKRVWQVVGVKGRNAILLHAGNDHTDTMGCILVGFGIWNAGITDSVKAIEYLRKTIGEKSFTLTIKDDILN
ncbi:DUF5675 family protein [Dyadobacter sp. CY327]|uniref:DUF5675 family protein n=1 Tax=Dyadobacter sp. CY327 TaxID=2907301 RepID=UPI001F214A00|nr:DUF5675 family protein [Dyadobacter sp. CY327]MCE7073698.1 DUF5675 family protein [Dyadobacter sp. CY327]